MKTTLISLIIFYGIAITRADLLMEVDITPFEIKTAIRIKGKEIRSDSGGISRIANLKTGENFILDNRLKQIKKLPALFDYTNTASKSEWPKPQDTGKTEILNGFEAEIYQWTSFDGRAEMLWTAKDYPNFRQIKNDVSKLDRLNNTKWIPELNSVSGMPLKLVIARGNNITNGIDVSITLLSAKEESIDDTNFDLPKDYTWQMPLAVTNAIIFETNAPAKQ